MQCELIFYLAHKTGYNETVFTNGIENCDLEISKTHVATSPVDLGETLKSSLERSNLVFIVGGLEKSDDTNTVEIMSKCLENKNKQKIICKRIENTSSQNDGYIVQSGRQMIVMLPDVPEELEMMMGDVLLSYICSFYSIEYSAQNDSGSDSIKFTSFDNFDSFLENVQRNNIFEYSDINYKSDRFGRFKYYFFKTLRTILICAGILISSLVLVYLVFDLIIYG